MLFINVSSDSDVTDSAEELSKSSGTSSKTPPDIYIFCQDMRDQGQSCLELFTQPIQVEDSSGFLTHLGNDVSFLSFTIKKLLILGVCRVHSWNFKCHCLLWAIVCPLFLFQISVVTILFFFDRQH